MLQKAWGVLDLKLLFRAYTDNKGRFVFPSKYLGWCTHGVICDQSGDRYIVRRVGDIKQSPLDHRNRMTLTNMANAVIQITGDYDKLIVKKIK